jgi:cytochrome c oxidase subunit III
MKEYVILDVSKLPEHSPGTASVTWWGTMAFMLIEGAGFALAIVVYLYLMTLADRWPPASPPPDLAPGTVLTLGLVISVAPNILLARWARNRDLRKVRAGLIVMSVLGAAPLALRALEFPALNTKWDDSAYGSITWVMLGLHTTHILTDLVDTLVLAALMFTRHGSNTRRFGDVEDNCMYWNFVVVTWLPIYFCLYWIPRL